MATVTSFTRDNLYRDKSVSGELFENNNFPTMMNEYSNDSETKVVGEYDDPPVVLCEYKNGGVSNINDKYRGDYTTHGSNEKANVPTIINNDEFGDDHMTYMQDDYREGSMATIETGNKNGYTNTPHMLDEDDSENMPNVIAEYKNENLPNISDYNSDGILSENDEDTVVILPREDSNVTGDQGVDSDPNSPFNEPITMVTSSETAMVSPGQQSSEEDKNSSTLFNGEPVTVVNMNSCDEDSYGVSEPNDSLDRIRESDSSSKSRRIFDSAMPSMLSDFPTMLSNNDETKTATRNGEASKRGKRKKYQKYTPQDRVAIGQYCFEHGPAAARKAFQFRYPEMSESVTRGFRDKYKVMIGEAAVYEFEQKRRQNELKERVAPLPRGRPRKYRAVEENEQLPPIKVNKSPNKGKLTFSKRKEVSLEHASMIAPRSDDRFSESPRRGDEERMHPSERSEDSLNIVPSRGSEKTFSEDIVHIIPRESEPSRDLHILPRDPRRDPMYVSTAYQPKDQDRAPTHMSDAYHYKNGPRSPPYPKHARSSPSYTRQSISPPYAKQSRYIPTYMKQDPYAPSETYEHQRSHSPTDVKPSSISPSYRKSFDVSPTDGNASNTSDVKPSVHIPAHVRPSSTSPNNTKPYEKISRHHGYSSNNSIKSYISIAPTSSHTSGPHIEYASTPNNNYTSNPPIMHFPKVYEAKKFMSPVSSERSFSHDRMLTNVKREEHQLNGQFGSPSDSHNNENMTMAHMHPSPDVAGGQRITHLRSKRFKYQKYTPEERFNIGKLCNEIGLNATVKLYREQYPRLNESVVRTFRNRYRELVEQGNGVPEIESIERKPSKRTSVTAMEEEVARQLKQFKIARVELTENLVLAVAENVIASRDPREKFDLQKWVSPVWAQTFLVRKQLIDADDKNKIPVCNKCNTRLVCPSC